MESRGGINTIMTFLDSKEGLIGGRKLKESAWDLI